ncbi:transporter [Acetobacter sp. DmW_043]|nr:LptF/LptG family permease [Acetobacter thailandicus]MBS0984655.1 LptF/LptG family permease [Acetobacter thailandicus]OUI88080.1 transporter [Acetobacter sp. DmW_043]
MLSLPFVHKIKAHLRPTTMDRYLITQTLPPFFLALSVVMIALLLERLLALFNLLAAGNNHLFTFLGLLTTLTPHYLGLAIPAALCVSVFTVVRRMSQNEEIDAINSSGMSLIRLTRPLMQLGLLLGCISFLLYGFIQPYARYDFRQSLYIASHTGWAPRLQSGVFASPSPNITIVADHVDLAGSRLKKVFIRDMSGHKERDITAKNGQIRLTTNDDSVEIDLQDGEILTIPETGAPTLTTFDHATRLLVEASHISPFRKRGDDERELTSHELIRHMVRQDTQIPFSSLRAELHFRLARSITIPFIPALAAALAIVRKRQRNTSGLIIAFLILVGFDHILQFGHSLVDTKNASPYLMTWLPSFLFIIGCSALLASKSGLLLTAKALWFRKPEASAPLKEQP